MEKSTLLTALLIGLVVLSGVQAIEIMSMKSDSSSQSSQGRVAINSNDDMSSHHGGGGQQQTSSQQSPQMVGGC